MALAHLWLRHLPRWFVFRMACVSVAWADARDVLLAWRAGLAQRQLAFVCFGRPDADLLDSCGGGVVATREDAAEARAAAAVEAYIEERELRHELWWEARSEFQARHACVTDACAAAALDELDGRAA